MIKLIGFDELMERLRELPKDFEKDADERLSEITDSFMNDVKKSISSGSSPSLEPEWEPIRPATQEIRRQKRISSNKPLYETGHMLSTLRKEKTGPLEYTVSMEAPISTFFGSEYPGKKTRTYNVETDQVAPKIPVTDRMRYYLLQEFGIRMGESVVKIPERPLFRPLADEYMQRYENIKIRIDVV